MEFPGLILPLTKNICRTCLAESDTSTVVQDLIEYETNKIKLIDILVFLNCLENNDEENWPKGLCSTCVSTALLAYTFKLNCLKANATLTQILMVQSSPRRSEIDSIDINVVYQDHEYELPLFSNNPTLDFVTSLSSNKELTPLPPVTEISASEQITRRHADKKFLCTICPKSFTKIYGLRYHMAKHTDVQKFLCFKCGKKFATSGGLRQHFITHKDTRQFKCGFCNKIYKFKQSLQKHFQIEHSRYKTLFLCIKCDKRYTSKSTYMMHLRRHNGEKEFSCPHCSKRYSRATYLRAHCLSHTTEGKPKPFTCDYPNCHRRFTTKHSLFIHSAHTHKTERPHKCDICSKAFPTKSGLTRHMNVHDSNNTEEICNICNKTLANQRVLQRHMKIHANINNECVPETNGIDVSDHVFANINVM